MLQLWSFLEFRRQERKSMYYWMCSPTCSWRYCCSVMQCVAMRCSASQCVAVCCSVLPCVVGCCSALQCVAAHCSVYLSNAQPSLGPMWISSDMLQNACLFPFVTEKRELHLKTQKSGQIYSDVVSKTPEREGERERKTKQERERERHTHTHKFRSDIVLMTTTPIRDGSSHKCVSGFHNNKLQQAYNKRKQLSAGALSTRHVRLNRVKGER